MTSLIMLWAFIPSLLYSVAGVWDAKNKGEKIDWKIFGKTLIIGALSAGLISTTQAGTLEAFVSSGFVTYLLDKLVNSIIHKA